MTSLGSGQTSGRALTGSGQNPGRVKNPGRVLTGQDDVSMTSAPGNLNRFDRVKNGSGQRLVGSCDWVKLTSA